MEKIFVHPECPFSEKTFELLAEFDKNPTSDFYLAHKKDLFKYVEEPLKYIFSNVEEQLPDFIKKNINIKHERFGYAINTKKYGKIKFINYSLAFCFNDENLCKEDYDGLGSQLMLRFEDESLTFCFYAEKEYFPRILYVYIYNNLSLFLKFKLYKFKTIVYYWFLSSNDDFFCMTIEPTQSIYELLESIRQDIKQCKTVYFDNFHVGISLSSEELLGYSAKQLIHRIVQTFKKLFPLFVNFRINKDLPRVLQKYIYVYENEFNPVYKIEEISKKTGFQKTQLTQWIHTINRKGQAIIQGPPGTGKTFIAERLAEHLIGGGDGFSEIIQFHPAYTYEDFIEGLRPQSENGQLTYSIIPGRFLQFCEKAEVCEDTCVLIIDEINRANLSQVFGELMYLLDDREDRKRFITLASGKRFRIPTNVRIIGTMNTADRSIALVDNALRRRFAFIPLYPNYELLRNYHEETEDFAVDELISILKNVNQAINNKHYELGISFFLTETLADDIQDIWQMEIEPYLEEYFFDNPEKMEVFRWDKIKDKFST